MTKIFCNLTDWIERKKKKRKGNIKYRFVLLFDKWCWHLAVQQEGLKPVADSYYGNMKILIPSLKQKIKKNYNPDIIKRILDELKSRFDVEADINFNQSLHKIGHEIDEIYGTSFHIGYPPIIYDKLAK
jgi:hypothetical protein